MRRYGGARSIITSWLISHNTSRYFWITRVSCVLTLMLARTVHSTANFDDGDIDDVVETRTETFSGSDGTKTGVFSSPNFPNKYPPNAQTIFHFRASPEEVVWITWDAFELEEPFSANGLCMRDYVEIIVIDYHNFQHISRRYCGKNKPPNSKTMQQAVDIIFQSSYTKHYQGFNGTYRFIHESQLPPPASRYPGVSVPQDHGCGGKAKGVYGGVIQNPGYPEGYLENIECNWVIRVDPGKRVYVRILELQLTASKTECAGAQLSVIDGYAHYIYENNTVPHQKHMAQFCGEDKYYKDQGARTYMSTRNRMVIRFNTTKPPPKDMFDRREEYGAPIGFYLVWTEVLPLDEKNEGVQCDKFLCRGGDYCLDETQTVCAERKRYCIDKSLLCDGIPNCGEGDDSDEENCYSKEIVAAGASLFLLLVLIIVTVICCQRRRGRKQLESIRRAVSHTNRASSSIGAAPLNSVNNVNALLGEENHLLKTSTVGKMDSNSIRQRVADITAFPENYHPARTSMDAEEAIKNTLLSIPNHVPAYAVPPATAKRISGLQDGGRRELVKMVASDSASGQGEGGSILRRRQGGEKPSRESLSVCVPLIKVTAGRDGPYSDRTCSIHNVDTSDTSTVPWRGPSSSKSIVYSQAPHQTDQSAGNMGVELVTFSATPKPILSSSTTQRAPPKPQGILKSSSSLPCSADQNAPCSSTGPPTPPVASAVLCASHSSDSSSGSRPPPPSYSQALARLGKQKAVEFVDELPKRHDAIQQQSSMPPLMLSPAGATDELTAAAAPVEDRSPSPWHRLKPSIV